MNDDPEAMEEDLDKFYDFLDGHEHLWKGLDLDENGPASRALRQLYQRYLDGLTPCFSLPLSQTCRCSTCSLPRLSVTCRKETSALPSNANSTGSAKPSPKFPMIKLTFWSQLAAISRGLYRFSDRLAAYAYRKSVQANISLLNKTRKDL